MADIKKMFQQCRSSVHDSCITVILFYRFMLNICVYLCLFLRLEGCREGNSKYLLIPAHSLYNSPVLGPYPCTRFEQLKNAYGWYTGDDGMKHSGCTWTEVRHWILLWYFVNEILFGSIKIEVEYFQCFGRKTNFEAKVHHFENSSLCPSADC